MLLCFPSVSLLKVFGYVDVFSEDLAFLVGVRVSKGLAIVFLQSKKGDPDIFK